MLGRLTLKIVPNMLLASEDIKQKQNERTAASLFPSVPAEAGWLFAVTGLCSCVHLRGEPVSSYVVVIFLRLVLVFLVDVNDVCLKCYHVHNVP